MQVIVQYINGRCSATNVQTFNFRVWNIELLLYSSIFMINKKQAGKYCRDDIRLIQGYVQAIADKTQTYVCHHLLEIQDDGKVVVSPEQLIENGLYYDRPAEELCFMTKAEHDGLHARNRSAKTKEKLHDVHLGKKHSDETKEKISKKLSGRTFSDEHKQKISEAKSGKPAWNRGLTLADKHKQKISDALNGTHWWNNGKINKFAKECPPGFVAGMLKLPHTKHFLVTKEKNKENLTKKI